MENSAAAPQPVQDDVLPLFFTHPVILTQDKHADAKMRDGITFEFARKTNAIPLTMFDLPEAAKHYPIVFTQGDTPMPLAIVGLEKENYFVGPKGRWDEHSYIPAYVRRYPFVFLEIPGNDQLTLCIESSALTEGNHAKGTPIFENGKPSSAIDQALQFCMLCQQQHTLAGEFGKALAAKSLLIPQRSNATLASGRKIEVSGFQIINAEKLDTLSESEVFSWFKSGMLAGLYHTLQSQSNWQRLLTLANASEKR